jgi:diguanylate cyclase (GGDEF)-like protein
MGALIYMLQALGRRSKPAVVVLGAILALNVGVLDYLTGTTWAFGIFYLLPICLTAWLAGKGPGVAVSVLSAVIALEADLLSGQEFSNRLIPYWNALVALGFFLVVNELLTELQEKQARIKELLGVDDLTTVANRQAFFGLANGELTRARRFRYPLTLAYIDLDDFKAVNDRGGHGAGDSLLFRVGDTLARVVRATDIVGRIGGDEFVILLPNTTFEQGQIAIQRFRELLLTTLQQHDWPVTCSIGAVTFTAAPDTVDDIVSAAEDLLRQAKDAGKNMLHHELRHTLETAPKLVD